MAKMHGPALASKSSLLAFRRPMQGRSVHQTPDSQSETDVAEEIAIEEEIALKMMQHEESPSQKLRRVAKGIRWQLAWMKDLGQPRRCSSGYQEIQYNNQSDIVTFNANLFKTRHTSQGFLTSVVKNSLQKPPWKREKIDLERIWLLLARTKAFSRYPDEIRKELPSIVNYEVLENGKKVLQEGQFGLSLFFILNGAVTMEVSVTDEKTGRLTKRVVREKIAGDSFGEKIIVRETSKMATVTCKGKTEFLRVDKEDIEKVLKTSYRMETERRIEFLKALPLFDKWVKSDIKLLNASSETVEYGPNTVVIKDTREPQNYSFFIISGQCQVVRELSVIIERLPFGREKYSLAPVDENGNVKKSLKHDRKLETSKDLYLVIQLLKQGDFFGVDEDIGKSSIISASKVELLVIPKSNLLAQQRGSFYQYIQGYAMRKYPNRTQTFQRYLRGRNWNLYKKSLVNEITRKRSGRLSASIHDVPRSLQKIS